MTDDLYTDAVREHTVGQEAVLSAAVDGKFSGERIEEPAIRILKHKIEAGIVE